MQNWPAAKIERRKVSALVPYANNARTHSDDQVAMIAASIREWGWTTPILVDEAGMIIAGHDRVLAAKSLGAEEVPAVVAKGWSEAQKRAYVIADNQLALNAGWDENLLRVEITALDGDFDIGLLGFSEDYLADLLVDRTAGLTDPDDAPPLPDEPVTRPGDLWICGRHRLLCGDSTNGNHVARLLGADKPMLMVTDPPYGVKLDMEWRDRAGKNELGPAEPSYMQRRPKSEQGAEFQAATVSGDTRADWSEAFALVPSLTVAYVWHASAFTVEVKQGLERIGFDVRQQIIWAKTNFAWSRSAYHWQHEPCWYAVRKGSTAHWRGPNNQTTLWEAASPKMTFGGSNEQKYNHPTQKPTLVYDRAISNHTRPGDPVYEPFSGSGTAIAACEQLGRRCFAMEVDPKYVDVAVKRWEAFTGQTAERDYDAQDDSRKSYDAAIEAKRLRANAAA